MLLLQTIFHFISFVLAYYFSVLFNKFKHDKYSLIFFSIFFLKVYNQSPWTFNILCQDCEQTDNHEKVWHSSCTTGRRRVSLQGRFFSLRLLTAMEVTVALISPTNILCVVNISIKMFSIVYHSGRRVSPQGGKVSVCGPL